MIRVILIIYMNSHNKVPDEPSPGVKHVKAGIVILATIYIKTIANCIKLFHEQTEHHDNQTELNFQ